ncbi:MAG: tetratricopeptide repeat protein [Bacteroidota bacterium]
MIKKINKDSNYMYDKAIRGFLFGIWSILIIFGILTLLQPKWLIELSKPGRKTEVQTRIDKGNEYLFTAYKNKSTDNYTIAVQNYTEALEIDPLNMDALSNLGVAYLYLNQLDKAKNVFDKCLEIDTISKYHFYTYLGDYYERKNDIENALSYYLMTEKIHPYPSYPMRKAGLLYFKLNKYNESIDYLNQSIAEELSFKNFYKAQLIEARYISLLAKDSANIKTIENELKKNSLDDDLMRYDKYIFEQTSKSNVNIAFAYMYLGEVYLTKSEYASAIENFQHCLQYQPKFIDKIRNKLNLAIEKNKEEQL